MSATQQHQQQQQGAPSPSPSQPQPWAATQRAPAQYHPQPAGNDADAFDRIGQAAAGQQYTYSSGDDGSQSQHHHHPHPPQQQQQQQSYSQPYPQQHHPQQAPMNQRNSSFSPLSRPSPGGGDSAQSPPSADQHRRTQSLRPFSAFQPLDQTASSPSQGNATMNSSNSGPQRPPSPTGSTTQSIRTAAAPLTFKSPELRSALSLQDAQQRKIYMEGYLSRRDALATDGRPLKQHDPKRSWHLCFVQLCGTVLSVWSVREMEQAAKQGTEVPPTYINVTDSFVDFIGNTTEDPNEIPGSRGRYENVFALNSAGNNRILFCVEGAVGRRLVQAWVNGIRLASWEKVRLEEIYTGALIRARLGAVGAGANDTTPLQGPPRNIPNLAIASPLAKGKMEGWVKARFMGSTEWKKCWLVLTRDKPEEASGAKKFWQKLGGAGDRSSILSISSKDSHTPASPAQRGSPAANGNNNSLSRVTSVTGFPDMEAPPGNNGATGVAQFFASKKDKKPMSTLVFAAHTFAVYPSRPELVEGSSLFKVEGAFPQSQVLSATNRIRQSGWVMIMPELDAVSGSKGANAEMMKWIIGFMDAFKLYGRPDGFVWDARQPASAFFAYPIGQFKDRLFLDRELAEFLDVREERHLASRTNLHGIMSARMRGERTPILPPLPTPNTKHTQQLNGRAQATSKGQDGEQDRDQDQDPDQTPRASPPLQTNKQLPPLDFGEQADSNTPKQDGADADTRAALAAHRPNGHLDTIGERSREGSTMTLPAAAAPLPHGAEDPRGAQSRPMLSVDPNYAQSDRISQHSARGGSQHDGSNSHANRAGSAVGSHSEQPSVQTAAAASLNREGSLASHSQRGSGALSPPTSSHQRRADDRSGGSLHAKSPSPVPSYSSNAQPQRYGNAESTDTGSVRGGRQAIVPSATSTTTSPPSTAAGTPSLAPRNSISRDSQVNRSTSIRDQQPRQPQVLAPSGRGAEAEPSFQQQAQAPTNNTLNNRRSENDFANSYDEGALFYLRSMSDQLPAPAPRPAQQQQQQQIAVHDQNNINKRELDVQPESAITADTPSTYTQPSYAASPAEEFSRNASLRRPVAAPPVENVKRPSAHSETSNDRFDEDALAAYSYLDQPPSPSALARGKSFKSQQQREAEVKPQNGGQNGVGEAVSVPAGVKAVAPVVAPTPQSYPSTFGLNKRAQDRKEAAQAQAAAHAAALSKPGKASGDADQKKKKKKGLKTRGKHAWGEESSDEEEEEEEDDDDDEEEERQRRAQMERRSQQQLSASASNGGRDSPMNQAARTAAAAGLPPPGRLNSHNRRATGSSVGVGSVDSGSQSGRSSPAVTPGGRSGSPSATTVQQQQQQHYQQRAGGSHPALAGQRQSVFNSHLAAPHAHEDDARSISPGSQAGGYGSGAPSPYMGHQQQQQQPQTFVQLNPNEQPGSMTAVFQPHGLLQAGAQDKAERSAKQQEWEARQAGHGMVNVPNKPPPPQAGLLGAISAHERDRKGAGGLGATLTERERQRVDAERRQREEDVQQQQGHPGMMGGWGAPGMQGMQGGFNPYMWQQMMMMNPMMMGMNPMAMGGGSQMGHGGGSSPPPGQQQQQGGMDPGYMQQQMAAAMMAQQAYMQAMSQAGGAPSMMSGAGGGDNQRPMSMSPSMTMSPSMGGHPMSMYGMPPMGMMGMSPYGMMSPYAGSEFGQQQQQQQQQGGAGAGSPSQASRARRMDNFSTSADENQNRNGSPLKR
ncbi:unnamed protein product [Sympodiomycopsis kandeliae]